MMIPSNTDAELFTDEELSTDDELDCLSTALEEDSACSLERGTSLLEEALSLEEGSLFEVISLLDDGSGESPLAEVESSQATSQVARQHVARMCFVICIITSFSFKNKQKEN
jgi:hypothetical protein